MSGKPKKELVAIYRLEFYRKKNKWKLSGNCEDKDRRRRDESKDSPPEAATVLNKTYNVERPQPDPEPDHDQSVLNDAFLDTPDGKNLSPPPNSPCSPTTASHKGLPGRYGQWTYDLDPLLPDAESPLEPYQLHTNDVQDYLYDPYGTAGPDLTQNMGPSTYHTPIHDIEGPQYNSANYDSLYDIKVAEIDLDRRYAKAASMCEVDGPLNAALSSIGALNYGGGYRETERPQFNLENTHNYIQYGDAMKRNDCLQYATNFTSNREMGPEYATGAPNHLTWASQCEQEGSRSDINFLGVNQCEIRPQSLGPSDWSDLWSTLGDPGSSGAHWSMDSEEHFLRGASEAPHSTEIDIDLDDSFECYTGVSEWCDVFSARPKPSWTKDHYNMFQPPPLRTAPHYSLEDIPTRDVCLTNDMIVSGSHRPPSFDWLAGSGDGVGVGRGRGRLHPQSASGRARGRTCLV